MSKLTVKEILNLKGKRKITATNAVDYFTAKAVEIAGIDIIAAGAGLVEYSIKGETLFRRDTLEESLLTLEGVRKGAPNTFLFTGLPYGYTFVSDEEMLRCATALMKGGADAVHISGSGFRIEKIKKITRELIPCAGHLGLIPPYATWIGGLRSVGKKADEAIQIYEDALKLQEAGAIWIELECVPHKVAAEITKRIEIPIIGIGSGPECDGQYLFDCDIRGTHDGHYAKHCKKYMNVYEDSIKVFKEFRNEVESKEFPTKANSFEIEEREFEVFIEKLNKF